MDVLRDVKNAEAEAERIAADYEKRATELGQSLAPELAKERESQMAAVEEQAREYRDELHRKLAVDRKQVQSDGEQSVSELERDSAAHRDAAVSALLTKLDSA